MYGQHPYDVGFDCFDVGLDLSVRVSSVGAALGEQSRGGLSGVGGEHVLGRALVQGSGATGSALAHSPPG